MVRGIYHRDSKETRSSHRTHRAFSASFLLTSLAPLYNTGTSCQKCNKDWMHSLGLKEKWLLSLIQHLQDPEHLMIHFRFFLKLLIMRVFACVYGGRPVYISAGAHRGQRCQSLLDLELQTSVNCRLECWV